MTIRRGPALVAFALSLAGCGKPVEAVSVGAARAYDLGDAAETVTVPITLERAGTYVVHVGSDAFDVCAAVDEATLLADEDLGTGFGELLTVTAAEPGRRVVVVGSSDGRTGTFEVSVSPEAGWKWSNPGDDAQYFELYLADGAPPAAEEKVEAALAETLLSALEWEDAEAATTAIELLAELDRSGSMAHSLAAAQGEIARIRANKARDSGSARELRESAREVCESVRDHAPEMSYGMGHVLLRGEGLLARAAGNHDEGIDLLGIACSHAVETGHFGRAALARSEIALVEAARGADDRAGEEHAEALRLLVQEEAPRPTVSALVRQRAAAYYWDHRRWEEVEEVLAPVDCAARKPPGIVAKIAALRCDVALRAGRFGDAEAHMGTIEDAARADYEGGDVLGAIEDIAYSRWCLGRCSESRVLVDLVLEEAEEGLVRVEALMTRSLLEEEVDLERAEATSSEGLELLGRIDPSGESTRYWGAGLRINRGRVLRKQERWDEARSDFQTAERLAEEDKNPYLVRAASHGLAVLHLERGHTDLAKERLELLTAEYEDYHARALAHTDLAMVELARSDTRAATEQLEAASDLLKELDALPPLDAAQVRSRYVAIGELYQDVITTDLARELSNDERNRTERLGLEQSGRWKGRALLASLAGREAPAAAGDSSLIHPQELAGDTALIEFSAGREKLYAYLVTEDGVDRFELDERASIEREVWDYYTDVLARPTVLETPEATAAGREVCELLLGEVLPEIPRPVERLILVPTAGLAMLPFGALVLDEEPPAAEGVATAEGGPTTQETAPRAVHLVDRFEVSYAPSSSKPIVDLSREWRRFLFLADARFQGEPGSQSTRARDDRVAGLERLEGSRSEVIDIASLLLSDGAGSRERRRDLRELDDDAPGLRDAELHEDAFDIFLGGHASVDRLLLTNLGGYNGIHLASHVLADLSDPSLSAIVLSPAPDGRRRVDVPTVATLRSSDQLVVLSACDSARGATIHGEGVQSIAAAFLHSGAGGVVASLWKVSDAETAAFMKSFYEELLLSKDEPTPAEALCRAQRSWMRKTRGMVPAGHGVVASDHPHTWAAFIYVRGVR